MSLTSRAIITELEKAAGAGGVTYMRGAQAQTGAVSERIGKLSAQRESVRVIYIAYTISNTLGKIIKNSVARLRHCLLSRYAKPCDTTTKDRQLLFNFNLIVPQCSLSDYIQLLSVL